MYTCHVMNKTYMNKRLHCYSHISLVHVDGLFTTGHTSECGTLQIVFIGSFKDFPGLSLI